MLRIDIISISNGKRTREWATQRKRRALLFFPRSLLWRATCAWPPSRLIYVSVSLFDSNYKAAFFTLAFFKIPAVEKSRNGKGILAEIFAWESYDYRYATNVENSNKVTGGTRGQMLEYVRMRLRKKNHSEMYRSWWYVVRTYLKN